MAIEDQQISFDMFHEEKALPDKNIYLKVIVMEEKRQKKNWMLEPCWTQDHKMMRQANDVKRALTGRQPDFSFPFLFFILISCM